MMCPSILLGLLLFTIIGTTKSVPTNSNDVIQFIILHNNDMHARFEQTDAYSSECKADEVVANKCYGGFARVAYK